MENVNNWMSDLFLVSICILKTLQRMLVDNCIINKLLQNIHGCIFCTRLLYGLANKKDSLSQVNVYIMI